MCKGTDCFGGFDSLFLIFGVSVGIHVSLQMEKWHLHYNSQGDFVVMVAAVKSLIL